MYSVSVVAQIFSVAKETVRKWAVEFADELEPNANPGEGRQRAFSDSDLEILALISEMKSQGKLYIDIHAALAQGEKGRLPDSVNAIEPAEVPSVVSVRREVERLKGELQIALTDNQRQATEIDLINRQLKAAEEKNDRLTGEIAVLKYRLDANIKD